MLVLSFPVVYLANDPAEGHWRVEYVPDAGRLGGIYQRHFYQHSGLVDRGGSGLPCAG